MAGLPCDTLPPNSPATDRADLIGIGKSGSDHAAIGIHQIAFVAEEIGYTLPASGCGPCHVPENPWNLGYLSQSAISATVLTRLFSEIVQCLLRPAMRKVVIFISPIRFLRAGSVDLVLVPGFISNVEETWDNPSAARWLERLGRLPRDRV